MRKRLTGKSTGAGLLESGGHKTTPSVLVLVQSLYHIVFLYYMQSFITKSIFIRSVTILYENSGHGTISKTLREFIHARKAINRGRGG